MGQNAVEFLEELLKGCFDGTTMIESDRWDFPSNQEISRKCFWGRIDKIKKGQPLAAFDDDSIGQLEVLFHTAFRLNENIKYRNAGPQEIAIRIVDLLENKDLLTIADSYDFCTSETREKIRNILYDLFTALSGITEIDNATMEKISIGLEKKANELGLPLKNSRLASLRESLILEGAKAERAALSGSKQISTYDICNDEEQGWLNIGRALHLALAKKRLQTHEAQQLVQDAIGKNVASAVENLHRDSAWQETVLQSLNQCADRTSNGNEAVKLTAKQLN